MRFFSFSISVPPRKAIRAARVSIAALVAVPALAYALAAYDTGQPQIQLPDLPVCAQLAGAVTDVQDLPPQARITLALIRRDGPFPYQKDGVTFQNRERRLPTQRYGYYHEFTVPTPAERDRGRRRIIAGAGSVGRYTESGEYYYTPDHYKRFYRICASS